MTIDGKVMCVLLAAAFGCGALLFWFSVRAVTSGVNRYEASFTSTARTQLAQMFLFIDTSNLLTLNALALVAAAVIGYLVMGSVPGAAVCCVFAFFLPRLLFKFFRQRRVQQFRDQMPDAIMLVSGALRAGASLSSALAQMVEEMRPPVSQEFDLFLREQRLGVPFETALDSFEQRMAVEEMLLLSAALRVSRETGGNLAETLERLAETLRAKLTIEGKIRALTAQGKLQGIVVGLLPVMLILVLRKMEPEAMSLMFHAWYGWATLAFIAVMEAVGALIIRKIVNIDV